MASSSRLPMPTMKAPWYTNIRSHLTSHPPGSIWSTSNERSLLEPYAYLASRPGKEIRSKLIDAFNFWLEVPENTLSRVREVVTMLHTSSLLMDDIEDNSDLRRGLPVAHKVYGTPQVLNTANYVYFLVFKEVQEMGRDDMGVTSSTPPNPPAAAGAGGGDHTSFTSGSSSSHKAALSERLLLEEMINLHRGQGLELLWRDTLSCPTEEEYVEMVRNKTGGLLRIAGGLMMIWSPHYPTPPPPPPPPSTSTSTTSSSSNTNPTDTDTTAASPPDLVPLLDLIGLLFQIRDDYMNLSALSYAQNKGFAEDLTEGKFSFPMIHGIRWSGDGGVAGAGVGAGGTVTRESGVEAIDYDEDRVKSRRSIFNPPDGIPRSIPRTALDSPHLSDHHPLPDLTSTSPAQHPLAVHAQTSIPTFHRGNTLSPAAEGNQPTGKSSILPNRQLLSILSSKPTDENVKRYAVSYLRDVTGSFAYCRTVMKELDRVIFTEVERVERAFQDCSTTTTTTGRGRNEALRKILYALRSGWWEEEDQEAEQDEQVV